MTRQDCDFDKHFLVINFDKGLRKFVEEGHARASPTYSSLMWSDMYGEKQKSRKSCVNQERRTITSNGHVRNAVFNLLTFLFPLAPPSEHTDDQEEPSSGLLPFVTRLAIGRQVAK